MTENKEIMRSLASPAPLVKDTHGSPGCRPTKAVEETEQTERTTWRSLFERVPEGYLAPVFTIDNVLSHGDLDRLQEVLAAAEPFSCGSKSVHYRNTNRTKIECHDTADHLWDAVRPLFQQIGKLVIDDADAGVGRPYPYGSSGEWIPVGVSPQFRVNNYGPGQHFGPHYDGFNKIGERRTFFTLVVYLADTQKEHGGATNFLRADTPLKANAEGVHMAQLEDIMASVQPHAGSAVVFHHWTKHEGQQLIGGTKTILNCDVLFERIPGTGRALRDSEIEAAQVLREAQLLEASSKFSEAIKLYQRVKTIDEQYAADHGVG